MRWHNCFHINVNGSRKAVVCEYCFDEFERTLINVADDFEAAVGRRCHDRREWIDGQSNAAETPPKRAT